MWGLATHLATPNVALACELCLARRVGTVPEADSPPSLRAMLNKSSRVWAPWFGMGCKAQITAIAPLWRGFATPQTARNRDDCAAKDLFSVALAPCPDLAPDCRCKPVVAGQRHELVEDLDPITERRAAISRPLGLNQRLACCHADLPRHAALLPPDHPTGSNLREATGQLGEQI